MITYIIEFYLILSVKSKINLVRLSEFNLIDSITK